MISSSAAVALTSQPAPVDRARPPSLYFVNGWADFIFIGGFSLLFFLGLILVGATGRSGTPMISASYPILLSWVANNPHFSATNHRLYASRQSIAQFPFTALVLPFVMLFMTATAFIYPSDFAPYFVKLYVVWAPYHFSAQTLGITVIYLRRAGIQVSAWERRLLSWFIFAVTLRSTVFGELGARTSSYFGISYPRFALPDWTATLANAWLVVSAVAIVAVVARWSLRRGRLLPLIVLLPALTHVVWFVYAPRAPNLIEFVNVFHSLQYMVIAYSLQVKSKLDGARAPLGRWLWQSARWMGVNVAIGAVMFRALPQLTARWQHADLAFSIAVVWTGLQLHHYFVDGVIWKLKNPQVAPLLRSIAPQPQPAT